MREEVIRNALCELGEEARVYFGGGFFREGRRARDSSSTAEHRSQMVKLAKVAGRPKRWTTAALAFRPHTSATHSRCGLRGGRRWGVWCLGPRAVREVFRRAPGQGGIRVEKDLAHGFAVALAPEHSGCDWDQDSGYQERVRGIHRKPNMLGRAAARLWLNPDQPTFH